MSVDSNQLDGALHEIGSMVELAHRLTGRLSAGQDKIFHVSYEDMSLLDFAICDIDRRIKELRKTV